MTRLLLALGLIAALAAQDPAPTPDPAPAAPEATVPAPDPAEAASVSQFGITWTFSKPHRVGRFVTGDWWVVGPVEVVRIDPACVVPQKGRVMNGSMLNPTVTSSTGFDSHSSGRYKPELNVALGLGPDKPLQLAPGSSLLSSIANPKAKPGSHDKPLHTIAILTVLDAVPPPDAFRPPYVAGDKTVRHTFAKLDLKKLLRLKVVGEPPAWAKVNAMVERPFVDFAPNWTRYHNETEKHGPLYGRDVSRDVGVVAVMLLADFPVEDKRAALIGMVQRGIDLYGIFTYWRENRQNKVPFPWRSDGGHSSGRKWPIMFAGALLGEPDMQRVASLFPGGVSQFQEDAQTIHVSDRHIALTNSPAWKPPYGGKRGKQPYGKEMLGMPEWVGNVQPEESNAHWMGHPYRRRTNGAPWHGMALACVAMGMQKDWGHDAFFDYLVRYTAIMSGKPDPFAALCGYKPVDGSDPKDSFGGKALTLDPWFFAMWQEHWWSFYTLPKERPKPAEQAPAAPASEDDAKPGETEREPEPE